LACVYVLLGGGAVMVHRPASYRVWGEGRARAPTFDPHTIKRMQVPLSPYSPISVLLRQPLSIKKSHAGAIQVSLQRISFFGVGLRADLYADLNYILEIYSTVQYMCFIYCELKGIFKTRRWNKYFARQPDSRCNSGRLTHKHCYAR
jgi:hypothetical protein